MSEMAALRTQELTKAFNGTAVLSNVAFEMKVGARQALIGPNGAGKTTFINLLTGNLVPTKGSVWINGRDVTQLPAHRRVKSGLARTFQINALLRELSVIEHVQLAVAERMGVGSMMIGGRRVRRETAEIAYDILESLKLEPAAGVPPSDSHSVFELIERLPPDVSVLFIEHDMKLVARFAQRISVLVAGQIVVEGTPQEIASNSFVRDIYLGHRAHG
jgi:branched-chain amino acid transport system ATP-binding protein